MIDKKNTIAKNIAKYFNDGDVVNLGVGIPTLSANYIRPGISVILHSESGFVGQCGVLFGPLKRAELETRDDYFNLMDTLGDKENGWKTGHRDLVDASADFALLSPGAACFDSSIAFVMARGGHLDVTVLGGLQVDEEGNLANWCIPGKKATGMGGAMDLASGAKKVIVAMEHCTKDGSPKVLHRCTFPLTAIRCVSALITDLCVIEFADGKMLVKAMLPGLTREELQSKTEARLSFSENVDLMEVVET